MRITILNAEPDAGSAFDGYVREYEAALASSIARRITNNHTSSLT